jgi:hypothetical protein
MQSTPSGMPPALKKAETKLGEHQAMFASRRIKARSA